MAIDCRAIGSGLGGDETLLRSILSGLAQTAGPGDVFPVLLPAGATSPAGCEDRVRFPPTVIAHRPGLMHFASTLPTALARQRPRPDLVLSLTHGPLTGTIPSALLVTDLSFRTHPEFYPGASRVRLSQLVPRQARRARIVVTISQFCRRDLIEAYGLAEEHVVVVPCGISPPVPLADDERPPLARWLARADVTGPFVLCLGNLHRRKNVARLIRAFTQARRDCPELAGHQLVLAGARWFAGQAGAEQEAATAAATGTVVALGPVDERQREYLLTTAAALAYVSLFEGFGLPPLEAMARGLPVLASNAAALPETMGDAALLVDPSSVDEIAGGLARVVGDLDLREGLRERGWRRAARFSCAATGDAAREVFRAALDRGRSGPGVAALRRP